MWTRDFWWQAGERAIRAAAACLAALLTVTTFDPTDTVSWRTALITAGMTGLVSLLLSIAAGRVGDPTDPSFIPRKDTTDAS